MPSIFGIDYSISSPAAAYYNGPKLDPKISNFQFYSLSEYKIPSNKQFHYYPHEPYSSEIERFSNISDWILSIVKKLTPEIIAIEGYSMGSKGKTFNIGEVTGILKHKLWIEGYELIIVPPTVIKKFGTGKGNAKKEQMVDQFKYETGMDLKTILQPKRKLGSPTTDIVDAYYLAKYVLSTL
jgi:Holliday junction resolvasome RuvABC endonuclease subunit